MTSLLHQINSIFYDKEKWNYYNLDLPNPYISPEFENFEKFVKKYLDYSNKTNNIYNILEQIEPYRFIHIITDFFLGILFYENNFLIKKYIDKQIKTFVPINNYLFDNSFKYFWFLICFYHDVGYYYEKNSNLINSLTSVEKDLEIVESLRNLFGVPKVFHNIRDRYLKYRLEIHKVYDHGIIGGMLLYDRLIKIYNHYKNFHSQKSFTHNGLYWSDSMIKYFQLIASIVFAHNIWFKNSDTDSDVSTYYHYGLNKLVISNSTRKISLQKHPLLFLLSLVDSIEPTKRFGVNFLNKVRIIHSKKSTIFFLINYNCDNEINNWFKSIDSLNNWLKLETNLVKNSHLEIIM